MTLRALAGQNPTLSVATDAELSAIETGFLLDGDRVWSSASGEYVYRPGSTAALSSTVIATDSSSGGLYAGRFIFTGTGPNGAVITSYSSELLVDTPVIGAVFTNILSVAVTTSVANERFDVSFTSAGASSGAVSTTFIAQITVDTVAAAPGAGTSATSTATTDEVSAAIRKIITIPLAGSHTIAVNAATANAATTFNINALSAPERNHGSLVVMKLGA
jgi:hypothetical protein